MTSDYLGSYVSQNRAGLRHVRTVRPNRAADFTGAAFLDGKKLHIKINSFLHFTMPP